MKPLVETLIREADCRNNTPEACAAMREAAAKLEKLAAELAVVEALADGYPESCEHVENLRKALK